MNQMENQQNPGPPTASSAWNIWYNDLFDPEAPTSLEASGEIFLDGLSELWRLTLSEAIFDDGCGTFSRFFLTWGNSAAARVDVDVRSFENPALLKLRRWADEADQHGAVLSRLAELLFESLQTSSRWGAAAIDWNAESREVLRRVELAANPEDL